MTVQFFQNNWSVVWKDVIDCDLDVLNDGGFLDEVNKTSIVLVPKKKGASSAKDFRLISFCNVLYKFVAKV
ncbi:hypothetical protein PTKIN_Ptkin03bG0123200 [Pterospermum kingtungense]